ncbi:hypothetical protein E2320_016267 [Naja naja]|nr:hypothetical protein E2320_016267 [Naja naja]
MALRIANFWHFSLLANCSGTTGSCNSVTFEGQIRHSVGKYNNSHSPQFLLIFPWQMDPVQKAVINHTFGVPVTKAKRPIISCNVCQIRFNSESQAEAHYKGNRHARRVKGIEAARTRQKEAGPREGDKPGSAGSPSSSTGESDSDRTGSELLLLLQVLPKI